MRTTVVFLCLKVFSSMNKKPYDKPFLTIEKLMQSLEDRGMVINDVVQAKDDLSTIGYYRLSAYCHPFMQEKEGNKIDDFELNTNWQRVIDLYHFDRELRLLVAEAVEWIEVILRAKITQLFSEK